MAGGAMGVNGVSRTDGGQSSTQDASAYAPSTQSTGTTAPSMQSAISDYYASLSQPSSMQDTISRAYQESLGRAPEAAGSSYWSDQAAKQGWSGQQLASAINQAGAPERARSGYQSQLDPSIYGQQAVNRPSYYNTNPFSVDYANIFNPAAGQVVSANQTLTPGQQAAYLSNWQNAYTNRAQQGIADARAQRVAAAQKSQSDYNTKKATAEAQATAANQAAINQAVQEALAQQQQPNYINPVDFTGGKSGGIASLMKGFKK